ncbi:MAG: hypothetical protein WCJ19_01580 [bacterium]
MEPQNTPIPSPNVNITPLNQPVYQPVIKPRKRFKKRLILIPGVLFILIVLVIIASLFVKIGDQAIASSFMDSVGNHKAAMGIDLLTSGNSLKAGTIKFSDVDLKNSSSCTQLWSDIKDQKLIDLSDNSFSFKETLDIRPINSDYKDKFYTQSFVEAGMDISNQKLSLITDISAGADFDTVTSIINDLYASLNDTSFEEEQVTYYGEKVDQYTKKLSTATTDSEKKYNKSQLDYYAEEKAYYQDLLQKKKDNDPSKYLNWGQTVANIKGQTMLTPSLGYLKLDNLQLKNNSGDRSDSLSDWYGKDFSLSTKQRQGITELISTLSDMLASKPGQIVSEDTGKFLMFYACSIIKEIKIDSPTNVEFGYGDYKVTKKVRPIQIISVDPNSKAYSDGLVTLFEKLEKDQVFSNYLKAQYDNIIKINNAGNKISNSSASSIKQSEYNKFIDEMIQSAFGSNSRDLITKAFANTDKTDIRTDIRYEITASSTYYMSMDQSKYYGSKVEEKLIFKDQSILDSLNNENAKDILKDGIVISAQVYDIQSGSKAFSINEPDKKTDINKLPDDITSLEVIKKAFEK